ncbi:MAG TPA: transcriptional regulator NrdR [Thermoleophilaceae bacterium]|nr:transcriptional regulator NrdR [Thermoleophilaceae bacterium]
MRCPFCSSDSTRVVDSRLTEPRDAVRRRRECAGCGNRFTTYERAEEAPVTVIKRDRSRQRFDRQKLLRGLGRAANKRPISDEQLEAVADRIAAEVRRGGPEADASWIGELSLRGLAAVDPVSAIQFASVYRQFESLDELEAEVRRLKNEGSEVPSGSDGNIGRSPSGDQGESTDRRSDHVRQP